MLRKEAVFDCADALTPDVAARLAQAAERFDATLWMEQGDKRVLLDSLIGILSIRCARGDRLTILAESEDAQTAADAIAAVLEKRG